MRKWLIIWCLLLLFAPSHVVADPIIDGQHLGAEWENGEEYLIEMNTGLFISFTVLYSSTYAYYMAKIPHNGENDIVNLDPDGPHDYFGIEFDNNKDEAIMGTPESPDDTIIVNYKASGAADMFMHSFKAFYDTDYNGNNDVDGAEGYQNGYLVFEIQKPLSSNDNNGYDIELSPGQTYQIMLGFWDDKPPHSAVAAINKRTDNSQFLSLTVGQATGNLNNNIISWLFLFVSLGLAFYFSTTGSNRMLTSFDRYIRNRLTR